MAGKKEKKKTKHKPLPYKKERKQMTGIRFPENQKKKERVGLNKFPGNSRKTNSSVSQKSFRRRCDDAPWGKPVPFASERTGHPAGVRKKKMGRKPRIHERKKKGESYAPGSPKQKKRDKWGGLN